MGASDGTTGGENSTGGRWSSDLAGLQHFSADHPGGPIVKAEEAPTGTCPTCGGLVIPVEDAEGNVWYFSPAKVRDKAFQRLCRAILAMSEADAERYADFVGRAAHEP